MPFALRCTFIAVRVETSITGCVCCFFHLEAINENGKYEDDENNCQDSGKRICWAQSTNPAHPLLPPATHTPPLAMHVMYMATTLHAQTWHLNVWMILPQVHLRKPCYDWSFLKVMRWDWRQFVCKTVAGLRSAWFTVKTTSTKVANIKMWKLLSRQWQANFATNPPPCTWPQRYVHKHDIVMCEWSFRRFTYGNLVTTSPSSKWRGSLNFERLVLQSWTHQSHNYSPNHSIGRSDGRCVQRAGT